ncbi:hypothetical protein VTK73DRAFT_6629 [Phialemonium thermophilum]|uniref:pH-response regulator protein palC n=1 Tax=Phialemonium thermophilum TaxID=223376 RepID=A0ABR3XVB0_9PEZI
MPYPFVLPTTSAFSFSSSFACESHPSLPLNASTYRGILRDALKKHKRLPASAQPAHLSLVISSLQDYLPYLLAIDAGLGRKTIHGDEVSVVLKFTPNIEWRPTLSGATIPGKEHARVKIQSLGYEISFVLSTLANAYTLQARAALHPLYVTSTAPVGTQQRQTAISTATKLLLDAASIYDHLARRAEALVTKPPCPDITSSTLRAQSSLAMAEATLLAVLKDDPYPAVVAQDRNKNDTEWMYKAPDIPKVRAHLFARLCLAASDHANKASSLCQSASREGAGKLDDDFLRYLEDLRRTSRAKACRFFGIDSELGGQTGTAIAWLNAASEALGVESKTAKAGIGLGFGRLRKEWSEKREDRKVEKGANWGSDAGRLEETRVIEMLEAKWTKQNDTMLTQAIPAAGSLLAQMPSGREIHTLKSFQPPVIARDTLDAMRAPPDRSDDAGNDQSSDEEPAGPGTDPVGAFPGTHTEYRTATPNYY